MALASLVRGLNTWLASPMHHQRRVLLKRHGRRARQAAVALLSVLCFAPVIWPKTKDVSLDLGRSEVQFEDIMVDAEMKERLDAAERRQMARAASIWDERKPIHPVLETLQDWSNVQRDENGRPIMKLVLIHGEYYHQNFPPFVPQFNFKHCRVPYCTWTQNKSRASEADALWFHVANFGPRLDVDNNPPPPRPSPSQVWIAATSEWDGVSCQEAREKLDNYLNWTMSYRRDADIWWPYGYAVRTPDWMLKPSTVWDNHIKNVVGRKSKLVFFQSKHCRTEAKRLEYVEQLRRYVSVEGNNVAGDCLLDPPLTRWQRYMRAFLQRCWPAKQKELFPDKVSWMSDEDLMAKLKHEYRFVIAFENALCQDYVTEKFWKLGLNADIIPIVRNGKEKDEIAQSAPPGSYINAREFRNPRELAAYLLRVASNLTLQKSYFEWKKAYTLLRTDEVDIRWTYEMASGDAITGFCQICEKLHAETIPYKTVTWSNKWCWENKHTDTYATKYSGCSLADDLEEAESHTNKPLMQGRQ